MTDDLVLMRIGAFALMAVSVVLARLLGGRRLSNIAYWNGLGMLALYACYCLSGMRFANGPSGAAELTTAALVAVGVISFAVAMRRWSAQRQPVGRLHHAPAPQRWRPIPAAYLALTGAASTAFYAILTQGQPWRLLSDGVGLKADRLQDIADKSPVLLNLDAAVLALCMVALAWSILAYRDDRRSKVSLACSVALILLYVVSTGSRTPLIAVLLQAFPAISEARAQSRHMRWLLGKKWVIAVALIAAVSFMIVTTGSRIEVEALNDDVFYYYFNLTDFGLVAPLLKSASAAAFFVATAITYAASTFNNVVIRFQELDAISVSLGYKFLFYYVSAAQILLPGVLSPQLSAWRDLATTNNNLLNSISPAAGQWATPYGDLLWDFGVAGTFLAVAVSFALAGAVVGRARAERSFANVLLKVVVVGFSLSPLVNPFLSLYVHYLLGIVIGIGMWSRRRAPSVRRKAPRVALARRASR